MAKTYNRLEIDVNKKPNSIGIRPVQNDTKSRYLDVCLYENGVPINLTGEQVRFRNTHHLNPNPSPNHNSPKPNRQF